MHQTKPLTQPQLAEVTQQTQDNTNSTHREIEIRPHTAQTDAAASVLHFDNASSEVFNLDYEADDKTVHDKHTQCVRESVRVCILVPNLGLQSV